MDEKHHGRLLTSTSEAQELCETAEVEVDVLGSPSLSNSPHGLCGQDVYQSSGAA